MFEDDGIAGFCSVVCTTYNHAPYSRSAIDSILAQDWSAVEVIVVDDGSTDENVAEIRDALSRSSLPSTLITQQNTGNPALNTNRALAQARGEFCCLISLDDLLLPDCISSKLALMRADPALVITGNSTHLEIDGDSDGQRGARLIKTVLATAPAGSAQQGLDLEFENIGTYLLQGTVFRTTFLRGIGGFDADITGDDLNLRTKIWKELIRRPDLRFHFLEAPGFIYRRHPTNLNRDIFRQVMTVLDWSARYFPERPLPRIAREWLIYFFDQCQDGRDEAQLRQVLEKSSEARLLHAQHLSSWRYRARQAKQQLSRLLRPQR